MMIKGKVIKVMPMQTGVSKAGSEWVKQEYVLETGETFSRKVHFDFFGERAKQYQLKEGEEITLYYDLESREYNGKWYTSVHGWKAERSSNAETETQKVQTEGGKDIVATNEMIPAEVKEAMGALGFTTANEVGDDLPF